MSYLPRGEVRSVTIWTAFDIKFKFCPHLTAGEKIEWPALNAKYMHSHQHSKRLIIPHQLGSRKPVLSPRLHQSTFLFTFVQRRWWTKPLSAWGREGWGKGSGKWRETEGLLLAWYRNGSTRLGVSHLREINCFLLFLHHYPFVV